MLVPLRLHFFDPSLVPELPPDVDFDEDEDDCWPPLLLWPLLLPLPWLKASWRTREGVPLLLFPELLRGFMFAVLFLAVVMFVFV